MLPYLEITESSSLFRKNAGIGGPQENIHEITGEKCEQTLGVNSEFGNYENGIIIFI